MLPQNRLTPAITDAAMPSDKPYKLADGSGLYLEVLPSGGKYWRLKYRYGGKEKRLALGVYPAVSIETAREQRDIAKADLAAQVDPAEGRRARAALNNPPASVSFLLSMDHTGAVTIEANGQALTLYPAQTSALKAFLVSGGSHAD